MGSVYPLLELVIGPGPHAGEDEKHESRTQGQRPSNRGVEKERTDERKERQNNKEQKEMRSGRKSRKREDLGGKNYQYLEKFYLKRFL